MSNILCKREEIDLIFRIIFVGNRLYLRTMNLIEYLDKGEM
jgi:hypothetical protein